MANQNLSNAKMAKNDEFYTQYHDIEIEVNAHLEHDPDVLRDLSVIAEEYEDAAIYKYLCQAEPDGLVMLSDEEKEAFEKKYGL